MIKINQSFIVDAPLEDIWSFLTDAPRVGICMPGVEEVEPVGNDRYQVKLAVKIGPIKARFAGYITMQNILPMESMEIVADWTDKTTASKTQVGGTLKIREAEVPGYEVVVAGEALVLGTLSKYGQGIADKMARKYAEEFAENMRLALAA